MFKYCYICLYTYYISCCSLTSLIPHLFYYFEEEVLLGDPETTPGDSLQTRQAIQCWNQGVQCAGPAGLGVTKTIRWWVKASRTHPNLLNRGDPTLNTVMLREVCEAFDYPGLFEWDIHPNPYTIISLSLPHSLLQSLQNQYFIVCHPQSYSVPLADNLSVILNEFNVDSYRR